jgi:hypothetical protein
VVSGEGFIAVYGYAGFSEGVRLVIAGFSEGVRLAIAGFSEGVRLVGVPCGVALIRGKEKGVGCMQ